MDKHFSFAEIQDRLTLSGASPRDGGRLEMIVARPELGARRVLARGELDYAVGLVGDNWLARGSASTADGSANPDAQITIMNSRMIDALAADRDDWPLAGDQLFIDLDLSEENLPAGQRIAIGAAVLEITPMPHTGCAKFTERFGHDAIRFVNSPEGRQQRRRGLNARVVQPGAINVSDEVIVIREG